jgi:hypothetical protein
MSTNNTIVGEWIYLAQMDYDYALKSANTFHPAPVEIICFHCQLEFTKSKLAEMGFGAT